MFINLKTNDKAMLVGAAVVVVNMVVGASVVVDMVVGASVFVKSVDGFVDSSVITNEKF